jgi:hypothetical protein
LPEQQNIIWAGRTLHGSDQFGEWVNTDEEGWDNTPDTKDDSEDRFNADGELDLPVYNGARLITFTGFLHAKSHLQRHEAQHWFNGAMSGVLQVMGHGPALWAPAKRSRGTKFTSLTDTLAQYQVQLKCVDPRKFGASVTYPVATGQPLTVGHRGNYAATPKFVVRGDMPGGYTLTVNGWNYTVTKALQAGKPHRLDYDDGLLYVDGNLTDNSFGNTNTTFIPSGPNGVGVGLYPVTTGSGTADMTVIDTYI